MDCIAIILYPQKNNGSTYSMIIQSELRYLH